MFFLILIGFVSGVVSGMGIGGGTILIPALVIFFHMNQQMAQSINLLYFIPTATIAIIIHIKNGNIEKKGIFKIIVFGMFSATIGSFIAVRMDSELLKRMFGIFLLFMGVYEFLRKDDNVTKKLEDDKHGSN